MIKVELEFPSGVLGDENKDTVRGLLREGEATVTFIKVDGTERVMRCTLLSDMIPDESKETKSEVVRTQSTETLRAYDTEKAAWRSFRWDSVRKLEK